MYVKWARKNANLSTTFKVKEVGQKFRLNGMFNVFLTNKDL